MDHLNISNVNALQSVYTAPHPIHVAPQPTYVAPTYEYIEPSYGYGYACPQPCHNTFVLVVVLFILLIIIGSCYFPRC
ncbi:YjcZ family sporulation protein [Fredinandcohnia sp. QZ13]|uniref:YjcZ family sporulation protein n=1 Tax=Fredinandcohnia sp. QZ13 TaxID=3073144 RepID=UPI00285355D2|nr:YjcZ family sporulation protein [Fredinandcohnia sp. QZ13]MDR4889680.1 YjcZ family sporulation protein [Fredinandcohnia sp. QZ13]